MPGITGFLVGVAVVMAGCDGCGDEGAGKGDTEARAPELQLGPLPEDVPLPGAIYRKAYDAALKEVDADNAHDRLRQIERQVARERRELQ